MSDESKREVEAWVKGVREGLTAPDLIPRSEAEAMVAAAYEDGARVCTDNREMPDKRSTKAVSLQEQFAFFANKMAHEDATEIRTKTPDDARAALDKMLAEAEARGARKAALAEMQHIGEQLEVSADTEARIAEAVAKERERVAGRFHDEQVRIWAEEILEALSMEDLLSIDSYDDKVSAFLMVSREIKAIAAAIRQTEGEG